MNTRCSFLPLLALAWIIGLSLNSHAANFVVTNLADSGSGSLRAAVQAANADTNADLITFDAALSGQSITLASALAVSNRVTIDASGLAGGISIIPSTTPNYYGIFELWGNPVVEMNHLTIMGGHSLGNGGGIFVSAGNGSLTLNHCTLAFNYAVQHGGAIGVVASGAFVTTLNYCTIANNIAGREGGGVYQFGGGQLVVNNCTFTRNTAVRQGGAIYASSACTVNINNSSVYHNLAHGSAGGGGGIAGNDLIANNSTIADNLARNGGGVFAFDILLTNCTVSGNAAYLTSGGIYHISSPSSGVLMNSILAGNTAPTNSNFRFLPPIVSNSLTNGDPLLASLGNYGGPTLTRPPLAGSPALDAGDDSVTNSLATDQRGYPRVAGVRADIGAVERQVVSAANAPVLTNTVVQPNGALMFGFTSTPDTDFTVRATTNVALPAGQWSTLGPATQNPPGQYQFMDILAGDYPQRFYQVTSP